MFETTTFHRPLTESSRPQAGDQDLKERVRKLEARTRWLELEITRQVTEAQTEIWMHLMKVGVIGTVVFSTVMIWAMALGNS